MWHVTCKNYIILDFKEKSIKYFKITINEIFFIQQWSLPTLISTLQLRSELPNSVMSCYKIVVPQKAMLLFTR